MNRIFSITLITTIIFCLISCLRNNSNNKDESAFEKYLTDKGISFNQESHAFIIISQNSCNGCISKYIEIIEQNREIFERNDISIITSKSSLRQRSISGFNNLYFDFERDLDYLNLELHNICIINFVEGKFDRIKKFKINQHNLFIKQFKKEH